MTKGKPYDFWNKNAMTYEVESLEKKNDQLLKDNNKLYAENKRMDELEWQNSKLQREVLDLQKKYFQPRLSQQHLRVSLGRSSDP